MLYLYHNVKIGLHYLGYYRSVLKNEKKCINLTLLLLNLLLRGVFFEVYCKVIIEKLNLITSKM